MDPDFIHNFVVVLTCCALLFWAYTNEQRIIVSMGNRCTVDVKWVICSMSWVKKNGKKGQLDFSQINNLWRVQREIMSVSLFEKTRIYREMVKFKLKSIFCSLACTFRGQNSSKGMAHDKIPKDSISSTLDLEKQNGKNWKKFSQHCDEWKNQKWFL